MTGTAARTLAESASAMSDSDPKTWLPVEHAREFIARFVEPVALVERVAIRGALGRVLAHDLVSPIDVPPPDNLAIDGLAMSGDDPAAEGDTRRRVAGRA